MIAKAKPIVPNKLVSFSEIPRRAEVMRYSSGWSPFDPHFLLVLPASSSLAHPAPVRRNRDDLLRYARAWQKAEKNAISEEPAAWVDRMFLTIAPPEDPDEDIAFDLAWLRVVIEEAATRHGAKVVVLDPWNEVEHVFGVNETGTTYTNRALRELRRLARRYQIAIVVVCHPTKSAGANKSVEEMSLYDISGSAAWKNKADHRIIIVRETSASMETYVKVDKSRNYKLRGRPGTVTMRFVPERASFEFVRSGS